MKKLLLLLAWLMIGLAPVLLAEIPEPPNIFYGSVYIGTQQVTAAAGTVVIEARKSPTGLAVASYRMGSDPRFGALYSLTLAVESAGASLNSNAVQTGDTIYLTLLDGVTVQEQDTVTIGERGLITRMDFGRLVDADGNGLPDAWERQYFGTTGVDPSADPDHDGRSNLQEFVDGTNPRVPDTRHPADNNPADNTIRINEVTAYGLAWKTGRSWPVAPNPIPIDYVTRAGTLWKGGESYILDTNAASGPPLWWVNVAPTNHPNVRRAKDGDSELGNAFVRRVERAGANKLTVTLTAQLTPGVSAYAIEEQVLPGATALLEDVHEGQVDASGKTVRWGPFFDDQPRTFTYLIRLSNESPDLLTFFGIGSFDGTNQPVYGRIEMNRFPDEVRLRAANVSGVGAALTLVGEPQRAYALEISNDLVTWTPLTSLTPDETGVITMNAAESGLRQRQFFRVSASALATSQPEQ